MPKETVVISWDWKEQPDLKDLKKVAELFGGHVYEDPVLEGTDSYGFVFSKTPLTRDELKQVSHNEHFL